MRRVTIMLLCSLLLISCFKKENSNSSAGTWVALRNAAVYNVAPGGAAVQDTISSLEIEKEYIVLKESGKWINISLGDSIGWTKRENLFHVNHMKVLGRSDLKTLSDTFQLKPGVIKKDTNVIAVQFVHYDSLRLVVDTNEIGVSESRFKGDLKSALASARFLDTLRLVGSRSVSGERPAVVQISGAPLLDHNFKVIDTLHFGRELVWSGDQYLKIQNYTHSVKTTNYYWVKPRGGRSGYIYSGYVITDASLAYDQTYDKDFAFTFIVTDTIGDSVKVFRPKKESSMVALKNISNRNATMLNDFCNTFVYHGKSYWDNESERNAEKMDQFIRLFSNENHPMLHQIKKIKLDMKSLDKAQAAADSIANFEYLNGNSWVNDRWSIRKVLTREYPIKGLSIPTLLNHIWGEREDGEIHLVSERPFWQFPVGLWTFLDSAMIPVDSTGEALDNFRPFFKANEYAMRQLYMSYNLLFLNTTSSEAGALLNHFYKWVVEKGVDVDLFTEGWGREEIKNGSLYPDFVFEKDDNNYPTYDMYVAFILRRSFDNSHYYIWKILTKLLWAYDREWYLENLSPFSRPPRDHGDYDLYDIKTVEYSESSYKRLQNKFQRESEYNNFFGRNTFKQRNMKRDSAETLLDSIISTEYYLAEVVDGAAAELTEKSPEFRFASNMGVVDTFVIKDSSGETSVSNLQIRHNQDVSMMEITGINSVGYSRNLTLTLSDPAGIYRITSTYKYGRPKKFNYWLIPKSRKEEFMRYGRGSHEEQGFEADSTF